MSGNGNIFETFEAGLVLLSIASVKLCFTISPLETTFFYSILPQINRLPHMSNINDCTKFEDSRSACNSYYVLNAIVFRYIFSKYFSKNYSNHHNMVASSQVFLFFECFYWFDDTAATKKPKITKY